VPPARTCRDCLLLRAHIRVPAAKIFPRAIRQAATTHAGLEHEPEPGVLRAVLGVLGAIITRAGSAFRSHSLGLNVAFRGHSCFWPTRAEQLGTAQRCLDMTVAYVKERRQFARPVGSFQALKHRLADVWVQLSQARAAARYAAACLADGGPDAPVAVALAKAACGDAAVHATRLGSGSQARLPY
jgi:hypothetical protein